MKLDNIEKGQISITFTRLELSFLANAINETLEALEGWEFQTRTSATPQFAKDMLAELGRFLSEERKTD